MYFYALFYDTCTNFMYLSRQRLMCFQIHTFGTSHNAKFVEWQQHILGIEPNSFYEWNLLFLIVETCLCDSSRKKITEFARKTLKNSRVIQRLANMQKNPRNDWSLSISTKCFKKFLADTLNQRFVINVLDANGFEPFVAVYF